MLWAGCLRQRLWPSIWAKLRYYKLYQPALSYEGKSPKTIVVYFSSLNRFLRYLRAKLEREPLLSDFSADAVMEYIVHLKTRGKYESHPFSPPSDAALSAFAHDQHVRTLKGFATWLHEKQYTRQNVLKTLERPKTPKLTIEPLSDDEIKRILASLNAKTFQGARDYALVVFFLDTGLRSGEVCGTILEDAHLDDRHPYVKVLGKGQKERVVYIGRRAHEALLAYRTFVRPHYTNNPNEKHFFVQREGKPLSVGTMQKIMARLGRDAKVPRLHPHLVRHTSATNYLVHGGDVISLQRKLGHSSLTMTDRYVHLASDQAAIIQERVAPMDKLDIKPMRVPRI